MGKPLPLTLLGVMNQCHLHDVREMTRQDDTTDTLSKHGGSLCYKEYDYEIVYVQGKFNVVADALSMINESPSTALYVRIR
jgi:hypothetical protein